MVGETVGVKLGAAVGPTVGAVVGNTVGEPLSAMEGAPVGARLSGMVGMPLGANVIDGAADGDPATEGCIDGRFDGGVVNVGAAVMVGTADGKVDKEGATVNDGGTDGSNVGPSRAVVGGDDTEDVTLTDGLLEDSVGTDGAAESSDPIPVGAKVNSGKLPVGMTVPPESLLDGTGLGLSENSPSGGVVMVGDSVGLLGGSVVGLAGIIVGLSCVSAVGMSVNRGVCSVGLSVAVGRSVGASNTVGAKVNNGVGNVGAVVPVVELGVGMAVSTILEVGFWVGESVATPDGCKLGDGDRLGDNVSKTGTKILFHLF